MISKLQILLAFVLFTPVVQAQEISADQADKFITERLVESYSQCAAYFATIADSYKTSYFPEKVFDAKAAQRQALVIGMAANKPLYQTVEEADKALANRIQQQLLAMLSIAKPDFQGISQLMGQYEASCRLAVSKPSEFMRQQQMQLADQFASND